MIIYLSIHQIKHNSLSIMDTQQSYIRVRNIVSQLKYLIKKKNMKTKIRDTQLEQNIYSMLYLNHAVLSLISNRKS